MSAPVQLVVGLGNIGSRYDRTRHNAGFWFVDRVAARYGGSFRAVSRFAGDVCETRIGASPVRLLKPSTYMNRSGESVAALARFYRYPPAQILVAHDEIDLPPGTVRLKIGGGDGGHRGLRDVIPRLGDRGFQRLRIGVGRPGHRDDVIDYVLRRAPADEQAAIDDAIERALGEVERMIAGDSAAAMNALHRKSSEPEASRDVPGDSAAADA